MNMCLISDFSKAKPILELQIALTIGQMYIYIFKLCPPGLRKI